MITSSDILLMLTIRKSKGMVAFGLFKLTYKQIIARHCAIMPVASQVIASHEDLCGMNSTRSIATPGWT